MYLFKSIGVCPTLQYNVNHQTPFPDRKNPDKLQTILPPADQGKARQQEGTITIEELQKKSTGRIKARQTNL